MEDQKNDSQESQPEEKGAGTENSGESSESNENPVEVALKKQLAEKEKQIADLARFKREHKKSQKSDPEEKAEQRQSDELDYGQKAYLKSSGIEPNEFDFVKEQLAESGIKDLDKLLQNPYFVTALKERREQEAVEKATPGPGRSGTGLDPKSQVDYWIKLGKLPEKTPENTQLRRDIIRKKEEIEKQRTRFTNQPIVDSV